MSACQRVARPIARSLLRDRLLQIPSLSLNRSFSQSTIRKDETVATQPPSAPPPPPPPPPENSQPVAELPKKSSGPDPERVLNEWAERRLMRKGIMPVGSRRRRAAISTSENIPFEELPYQCFQEARKILQRDRKKKLRDLFTEIAKMKRLEETPAEKLPGGEAKKQMRLKSMKKWVEELKILVDSNDPMVKRKFEDGLGDYNKPIYRHLAEKKWRGLPFRIITQRIEQFHIVPDVLPKFEPIVDVQMAIHRRKVEPGEILNSLLTERPPRLRVQVFNPGERLVSVVVMDSDVPNVETDSFDRRLHYLAANVPIAPTHPSLPLSKVNKQTQLAVPWLPPFSQKGAPYRRLTVWILEQKPGEKMDIEKLREMYTGRDGFSLKSYRDKFGLTPVGFNMFRTVWDENTATVMERHNIPDADVEFKPKRVYSLKPEKKARGWEAKRQGPKYKSVWKYTKMIKGFPRYRG